MVFNIIAAIDSSEQSLHALGYAAKHLCHGDYHLRIVTVLPPVSHVIAPAAPIATAGAVTAVTHQWEAQHKADKAAAGHALKKGVAHCLVYGLAEDTISCHTLPAAGGASGVAESIVEFASALDSAVVVIGSRGYGSWKRSMMSVVGLGSVGDYCVHRAPRPVVVVKTPAEATAEQPPPAEQPLKVCVCVDDSEHSRAALAWALRNVVAANAELHVVSVAQPVALPLIDEATAAVATLQAQQWEEDKKTALANAEGACAKAIDAVLEAGVKKSQVYWKALHPEGGASDLAKSLVHYARDNDMTLCVLGSHGYGAWKRSLMSFMGLGSVSDYCVHNLPCAVCVVKPPVDANKQK